VTFGEAVWRIGETDGAVVMEPVFAYSGEAFDKYFDELFTYKNALYAIRSNGELWKTKNGTRWFKIHTDGFPKYDFIYDYVVTTDEENKTIYVGVEGLIDQPEIYTSKKGSKWRILEGNYQDAATGSGFDHIGVTDLAIDDNRYGSSALYVAIKNDVTEVTSLWSYDGETWSQHKASADEEYSYLTTFAGGFRGLYSYDVLVYNSSTLYGCDTWFSDCYEDLFSSDDIVQVVPGIKKAVIVMSGDDGYYLLRL
jgi:hypothetical protein